jgi:lipoyl(octanoyl) transferase
MKIRKFKSPKEYGGTLIEMEALVENIIAQKSDEEIWLLEHGDVYTAGTSAIESDLINKKFPLFKVGRGGKHTYHGPGQRIIYLMLELKKHYGTPDLKKFVHELEQWVIDSLEATGIDAYRKKGMIGIWVKDKSAPGGEAKIAAIGIRVRKWISFHGIAINVNPQFENFEGIVPCGIAEFGVTSLKKLGKNISMEEFDKILLEKMPFREK